MGEKAVQPSLFDGIVAPQQGRYGVLVDALEEWLEEEAPRVLGQEAAAKWLEGYWLLRKKGVPHRDAMLAMWLSLGKDDRGVVDTREKFAHVMGVSRATTYEWENRRPEIRDWAEFLQVLRLRGSRLAEVDEAAYEAAKSSDGSAADRQLYYRRAGVWEEKYHLKLAGGDEKDAPITTRQLEPVPDLKGLTDEELELLGAFAGRLAGRDRDGEGPEAP